MSRKNSSQITGKCFTLSKVCDCVISVTVTCIYTLIHCSLSVYGKRLVFQNETLFFFVLSWRYFLCRFQKQIAIFRNGWFVSNANLFYILFTCSLKGSNTPAASGVLQCSSEGRAAKEQPIKNRRGRDVTPRGMQMAASHDGADYFKAVICTSATRSVANNTRRL